MLTTWSRGNRNAEFREAAGSSAIKTLPHQHHSLEHDTLCTRNQWSVVRTRVMCCCIILTVILKLVSLPCLLLRWGLCTVHKATAGVRVEAGFVNCESAAPVSPAWCSEATRSSNLSVSSTSFADIIRDELLQTATFEHTTNKSLALIQVLCAAINTGILCYN